MSRTLSDWDLEDHIVRCANAMRIAYEIVTEGLTASNGEQEVRNARSYAVMFALEQIEALEAAFYGEDKK